MELLWIKYAKNNRYYLILHLGTTEEHIISVDHSSIDPQEFKLLKASLESLKNSDLGTRVNLVKLLCPESYKNGFRKFTRDKTRIVQTIPLQA